MQVKEAFPNIAVLRKDFLFSPEDIDISYRAGADAVLLIASIMDSGLLGTLYKKTKSLGMEALVEIHSHEDIKKVKNLKPELIGINSRDLLTFNVDLTIPIQVKNKIDWKTSLLFESGIHHQEDGLLAISYGFRGLLVGESVVKDPSLIKDLLAVFNLKRSNFWERLYQGQKPFIKICGITSEDDAYFVEKSGADILGFVFAQSKRMAKPALLKELKNCNILKVGVVTHPEGEKKLNAEVNALLEDGLIDAIQLHGDESPEDCLSLGFPYYKALQIRNSNDIQCMDTYKCPRILVDAYSETERGGTGKNIQDKLLYKIKESHPLWIAGGLGPDNIGYFIDRFSPEFIDASSRLEKYPGKKDHNLVSIYIKEALKRKSLYGV